MKNKFFKKLIIIFLLIIQLIQITGNLISVHAIIKEGDKVLLKADHKCNDLLQFYMPQYDFWSYKEVWYVCYQDIEDGNKYPAFCVEPKKDGVGMTYSSYDATIKKETDNRLWRILDKGYMGSSWKDWNIESDDDFYYATKVAVHSLMEGTVPKEKYRLGVKSIDGNSVEDIQRRGQKVLDIAQTLYEYGISGTDAYQTPKLNIIKSEEAIIQNINNISYYVQNYQVSGNKSLKSYEVEIQNFPEGTKIFNSQNQEKVNLDSGIFKIAIPTDEIIKDIKGLIYIKNAFVKTNPIFLCESGSEITQNYVTYMSGYEVTQTSIGLEIKANTASLEILKLDKDTRKPIADVTFEIKDEQNNKITEVTTNKEGIAFLTGLYPQTIKVREISVPDKYILSNEEKEVKLEWNKKSSVTFENELKKGNLKVIKVDADDQEIKLGNVEFELFNDKNQKIKKIVTDENGEIYVSNLTVGNYILKETKTLENYKLSDDAKVKIEYNKTTEIIIENEKKKGQIKILKISEDDNLLNGKPKGSPLEDTIFEIRDKKGNVIENITTNEDGIAISSRLDIGEYTIKEIKTNEYYELTDEEYTIEILQDEEMIELTITNISKKPKLPRTGF